MAYDPIGFVNDTTPDINAENLNKMDNELVFLDKKASSLQNALSLDTIMVAGNGNTYIGNFLYEMINAGALYRFHIISWSKEGLTQSANAYYLRIGYSSSGEVTWLRNYTTAETLPEYIDIKFPDDVENIELAIGGRVAAGQDGILKVECLDIQREIDNLMAASDFYQVFGIGNTFTSINTGYVLKPGHAYTVKVCKWPHGTIPSSSSAILFELDYYKNDTVQNIVRQTTNADTRDYYNFVFPASDPEAELYVGGRVDRNEYGIITIEDITVLNESEKNTEIRNYSEYAIIKGIGNTADGYTTNIKLYAGSSYRIYVKKWPHSTIPSSSSATLLQVRYDHDGTKTNLKNYTTNSTLPDSFTVKVPDSATEPLYLNVIGRIDNGKYGIISIENIDEIGKIDRINSAIQNIFVVSAGNNVYASGDRDLKVISGHYYKIRIIDWDSTNVPTSGAGALFQYGYVVDSVSTTIRTIQQTTLVLEDEYLVYIPNGLTNPTLRIGGRVSSGYIGIVEVEDLTGDLPNYVQTLIDKLNGELENHQSSNSFSFAFITDIHVSRISLNTSVLWAMLMSKMALNEINKKNPVEMVVFNGDYLNNGSSTTKETVLEWYKYFNKVLEDLDIIQFRGKGNHDTNDIASDSSQHLTDEDFFNVFAKKTSMKWYKMDYGNMVQDYGYYDDVNRKIRIIFINTVDVPVGMQRQHVIGISNRQLNFVADCLEFTEPDWAVVFCSHHALQDNIVINPSGSTDHYIPASHGGEPLLGVINAFMEKSTYSYIQEDTDWNYDVSVDYSGNASSELIAMFSGHTHRDAMTTVDGYVMLATTSAGISVGGYDSEGNQINKKQYTVTETSWDIITIDRKNKKVYADRYGGETSREISYGGV